ncbi:MAG: hypothetical protein P3W87_002080, partial [Gammaproteobacteria bacterium]|nr:hypothetical protein [Gammaproteobacteria bacterium]
NSGREGSSTHKVRLRSREAPTPCRKPPPRAKRSPQRPDDRPTSGYLQASGDPRQTPPSGHAPLISRPSRSQARKIHARPQNRSATGTFRTITRSFQNGEHAMSQSHPENLTASHEATPQGITPQENQPARVKTSSSAKYQHVINIFLQKYREENDPLGLEETLKRKDRKKSLQPPESWWAFANWVIQHTSQNAYSSSYKMLLRSALLYQFEKGTPASILNPPEDIAWARTVIRNWHIKEPHHDDEDTLPSKNPSRPRARVIPKDDWLLLIKALRRNPGLMSQYARILLIAGVGCGARPFEWITSFLVSKNTLRIYNAKIKLRNPLERIPPGIFTEYELENPEKLNAIIRSEFLEEQDPTRRIFLHRLELCNLDPKNPDDLWAINLLMKNRNGADQEAFRDVIFEDQYAPFITKQLEIVNKTMTEVVGKNWRDIDPEQLYEPFHKHYYAPVRHAVWRTCKKLFNGEKIYSPADTRSIFAANRKRQYGTARTQKDLGHASEYVTSHHYGSARHAWKNPRWDEPDPEK